MINVTKPYLPDINKYKRYIDKIYDSGWVTNNGRLVQELENRLAEYLGVKHIVLVANGTLALQLAYKLMDLTGEVITTPYTFVATSSSLVWEGLTPVFVDIDEDTLNIDVKKIESKINENTSAIVPVHIFGNACDVEEIEKVAKKHNLKVIYDAAHAFGVNYKGKNILNYGHISTISFHATKVFQTIEGGALIINDEELYRKARKMINFGINDEGEIDCLGINAKMNEFQAAMGLCVLDDIESIFTARKRVYEFYYNELSKISTLRFPKYNNDCTKNYGYFPVIFQNEKELLKVKDKLESCNIFPRRYFYPSLDKLNYVESEQMVVANEISKRVLCLPMFDSLTNDTINMITDIINLTSNKKGRISD